MDDLGKRIDTTDYTAMRHGGRRRANSENLQRHRNQMEREQERRMIATASKERTVSREETHIIRVEEGKRYKIIGWSEDDNKRYGGLPSYNKMEEPGKYFKHVDGHRAFLPDSSKETKKSFMDFSRIFSTLREESLNHLIGGASVGGWSPDTRRKELGFYIENMPMYIENKHLKAENEHLETENQPLKEENKMQEVAKGVNKKEVAKAINDLVSDEYQITKRNLERFQSELHQETRNGWYRPDRPNIEDRIQITKPIFWQSLEDEV